MGCLPLDSGVHLRATGCICPQRRIPPSLRCFQWVGRQDERPVSNAPAGAERCASHGRWLFYSSLEVAPAPKVTVAEDAAEVRTETTRGSEQPAARGSADQAGAYRRPLRFLRDTAPPLTKPAPLRLDTSRKWTLSGRERLAERRRLPWRRVKDARDGLPRRREVFQPAGVPNKTSPREAFPFEACSGWTARYGLPACSPGFPRTLSRGFRPADYPAAPPGVAQALSLPRRHSCRCLEFPHLRNIPHRHNRALDGSPAT